MLGFGLRRRNGREKGPLPEGTRRLGLVFRGEVQGVGFRWTSQHVAGESGCTGWVRNEDDGSVSMELQGTDDAISEFFGHFSNAYARYPIDYRIDSKVELEPVPGEVGFRVRY